MAMRFHFIPNRLASSSRALVFWGPSWGLYFANPSLQGAGGQGAPLCSLAPPPLLCLPLHPNHCLVWVMRLELEIKEERGSCQQVFFVFLFFCFFSKSFLSKNSLPIFWRSSLNSEFHEATKCSLKMTELTLGIKALCCLLYEAALHIYATSLALERHYVWVSWSICSKDI